MVKKPKNIEFDSVTTNVDFDTQTNLVTCTKTFYKGVEVIKSDVVVFDLCVTPLQVALQMASGYVQMCTLTEYE